MFIVVAQGNIKYFEYCKKAYKASEFFTKLLYRKENMVMSYFQTYELKNKWDGINDLYKAENFEKVNANIAKKVNEIEKFITSLPTSNNYSIGNLEHLLNGYFDFSKIKKSGEQERIDKLIDAVKKVEVDNEKILSYINFRWDIELIDNTMIDILKKVMVF